MRGAARQALDHFGIEPARVSLIQHLFNTTFAVTGRDGARYVLHILRPDWEPMAAERQRARIESELWWLERVRADLGLLAPSPVRGPAGEGVVGVSLGEPSSRLCTLFRWVDGRFLRRQVLPTHLHAVGRLTARLHDHSQHLQVPPEFDRPTVDVADMQTEDAAASTFRTLLSFEAAETIRRAFRLVREAQEEVGDSSEVFGVIHADIHQHNYLFARGQIGLIDFGDCGWGHHLYDFAVTLNELLGMPRYPELRAALLAGYREVRALSAGHEALIDTFIVLRQTQDLTWFLRARDDPTYSKWSQQIGARLLEVKARLGDEGENDRIGRRG